MKIVPSIRELHVLQVTIISCIQGLLGAPFYPIVTIKHVISTYPTHTLKDMEDYRYAMQDSTLQNAVSLKI